MKSRPIIALLTDFGGHDQYVGAMKGVMLSINPRVSIVDITHDVAPHQIDQAAFLLWSCYRYFPKGTIFACIVDPEVGGSRAVIYTELVGYRFLAPDNGILKFIAGGAASRNSVVISNARYFLKNISPIFHGRDVIAPAAGHISKGVRPQRLGPALHRLVSGENFLRITSRRKKTYSGRILHIDRFGNIVTNVMLSTGEQPESVDVGRFRVSHHARFYAEGPRTKPFTIIGSSGLLEISLRNSSASQRLFAKLQDPISVRIGRNA